MSAPPTLTRAERDELYHANVKSARAAGLARLKALQARFSGDAGRVGSGGDGEDGSDVLAGDVLAEPAAELERLAYNRAVLDTWRGETDFAWTYNDEIEQIVTGVIGEGARERSTRLIESCLAPFVADAAARAATAAQIEQSCFNTCIAACQRSFNEPRWNGGPFKQYYSERVAAIAENLDPASPVESRYLGEELAAGRVEPEAVGHMSPYELCPPATRELRADLDRRSQMRVVPRPSTLYPCPRCRKRECTYQERQLARADEASTLVLQCLVCHHQWMQ